MSADQKVMEVKGDENGRELGDKENDEKNPLELIEIVAALLAYLPVRDLEVCRLVSRKWNSEACRHLKKKQTIVFKYPNTVKTYLNTLTPSSTLQHTRFEISVTDTLYFLMEMKFAQFWDQCGQHIKYLEFAKEGLTWQYLGGILSNRVPNLETLSFVHLPWNFSASQNSPMVNTKLHQNTSIKTLRLASLQYKHAMMVNLQLTDILKALPKLEIIDIMEKHEADSNVLFNVLSFPDVSLPRLRSFGTHLFLNQERLSILTNIRTSLQKLDITLEDGVTASSFKSLIDLVRPTLLELKITFPDHFGRSSIYVDEHSQKHISLLTNLRTLHLANFKWPKEFVAKLPTCFPHLRCLHVKDVDDEKLRLIYKGFPLLTELELTDAHCTDWGLTGISLEVCNDMLETCSLYDEAGKHRTDLYIGCLPYLQKLTVIGSRITDVSVALGLAECRNLQELKVGSTLILNKGIIFLVDQLGKRLRSLDLSECPELTDVTKFYAEAMTKGTVKPSGAGAEAEVPVQAKKKCGREKIVVRKPMAVVLPRKREEKVEIEMPPLMRETRLRPAILPSFMNRRHGFRFRMSDD